MRFAIVCVCYNTYDHLRRFVESLREARAVAPDVTLHVVIVDHSTEPADEAALAAVQAAVPGTTYLKSANVGYFPGFTRGLATLDIDSYDYIAISNVDLEVDPGFLAALRELPRPDGADDVGMIAPAILSGPRETDFNPYLIDRPSSRMYRRRIWLHQRPWLLWLYGWLSSKRPSRFISFAPGTRCFAPHGSFMIFTRQYFLRGGGATYPCFLYGEECYVGEECRRIGVQVRYHPSAIIRHVRHASTGRESFRRRTAWSAESLRYILGAYRDSMA